jgi:hypothetical protein
MKTPPWWDDARTPIAFLVSPLAAPVMTAWNLHPPLNDVGGGIGLVVSAFVAYVGVFALGLPTYRYLLARKLTAFWIAPMVGFIAGTIMMYVVYVLFALALGYSLSTATSDITDSAALRDALRFGGTSGAAVGAILWLIARPDRPTQ